MEYYISAINWGVPSPAVFIYSPGLKALKVGGMFAAAKTFEKNMFKKGVLEQMRDELIKKDIPVPAIAQDQNYS